MTYLKPITDAIDEVLAANAVRLPTIGQQINTTGFHPIANGRTDRGRHAQLWTADGVLQDALDGLDCGLVITARHRSRDFFGGAFGLLVHEVVAADWTIGVLTA